MKLKISYLNKLPLFFVFLFSVLYFFQFINLSNGNIVNSYPFITPDGFDWYLEGIYLYKILTTSIPLPQLPVLRPPVFVFINLLDYYFYQSGIILGVIYCLCIPATFIVIDSLIKHSRINGNNYGSFYKIPLSLAVTFSPLNFIRPYLLADVIACLFALVSVLYCVKYFYFQKNKYLLLFLLFFVLGGLTQLYALIPLLIFFPIMLFLSLDTNRIIRVKAIFGISASLLIYLFLLFLWLRAMPHQSTPNTFLLLKLSMEMFDFYKNIWICFFWPFIFFALIYIRNNTEFFLKNSIIFSALMVVIFFGVLSFFYQWPESRYTFYLWPWFLLFFFAKVNIPNLRSVIVLSALLIINFSMAPANYWQPTWASTSFNIHNIWIVQFFAADSVDRKISCTTEECLRDNLFLSQSNPYINSSVKLMHKLLNEY
jgi:hypothetical protein